ncbi:lipopolysaccharide biosynthesis protein [Deinococcus aetherius]|uniref:lipopolysaccharide biosynthesis protein n=1 Tax=Deinococcus aetherius TaxID=200252 RepID=UPI002231C672|nr:oligosaccharide flippase family protein [Deinococcus aetherius]
MPDMEEHGGGLGARLRPARPTVMTWPPRGVSRDGAVEGGPEASGERHVGRRPGRAMRDSLIANAVSLVATSAVTSGLGFGFWWLAARVLPAEGVGLGSAAVSAMMLVATLSMLGLGTLLISELPGARERADAAGLMSAALLSAAVAAALLAVACGLALPHAAPSFAWIARDPASLALFVLGVVVSAVTLVFDQAVIGLLRGELQWWRNAVSAVVKLLAVLVVGQFATHAGAQAIYGAWFIGNVASVLAVLPLARQGGAPLLGRPNWSFLARLGGPALRHHALNLAMQAPALALPVLAASQLIPGANAAFYVSWMIASFLGMVPYALATVLPAASSQETAVLRARVRASLRWSLLVCAPGAAGLILTARPLLALFGPAYEQHALSLQVLALTALPVIVKAHYIALGRVRGHLAGAAVMVALGGGVELAAAALGGRAWGVVGLSVGLLIAYGLEALCLLPTVLRGAGWPGGRP